MVKRPRTVRQLDWTMGLLDPERYKEWPLSELELTPSDGRSPATGLIPSHDPSPETSFIRSDEARWFVVVGGLGYEVRVLDLVRRFESEDYAIPDEMFADAAAVIRRGEAQEPLTPKPISLNGPKDPVIVVTRRLPPLGDGKGDKRYKVLKAVVDAFPLGLTEDDLKEASRCEGAVGIYHRLRGADPAYALSLIRPERRGRGGYRCVWPGEWRAAV